MSDRIFSTDTDAGTITVLEPKGAEMHEVGKIIVGNGPRGPAVFTADGRGFITNHAGNTVSEIDPINMVEVARIPVGAAPLGMGIVPGDVYLLVSNDGENSISVIDLSKRKETTRISVGREPKHMEIHKKKPYAYVCIWGAHSVAKLNIAPLLEKDARFDGDLKVESSIFLGKNAHPYSLRITPDGHRIIVANNQVDYVSVIDEKSGEVEKRIDVGSKGARGVEFSSSGEVAFVSIEDTNEILVIDLDSLEVIERLEAGPGPRGMLFYDNMLVASAFSRAKKEVGMLRLPNSLSIHSFGAPKEMAVFRGVKMAPEMREVQVGAGPCSLAVYAF